MSNYLYQKINHGRINRLYDITKQIIPEVIILGCIYALPAYRDLMRAEGPKHIPIY